MGCAGLPAGGRGAAARGGVLPASSGRAVRPDGRVDLVRNSCTRLLGVATLRVEHWPGAVAAEVDLDVVTLDEARALRASLLGQGPARGRPGGPGGRRGRRPPGAGARPAGRPGPGGHPVGITTRGRAGAAPARARRGDARPGSPGRGRRPRWSCSAQSARPATGSRAVRLAVLAVRPGGGHAHHPGRVRRGRARRGRVAGPGRRLEHRDRLRLHPRPRRERPVVRRGLLERREAVLPWPGSRWSGSRSRCCAGPSAWPRSASRAPAGPEGRHQTASRLAIPVLQRAQVNRVLEELLPGAAPVPRLRLRPRRPAAGR